MTVTFILLLLIFSFIIHVLFVAQYAAKREEKYFRGFVGTGAVNVLFMAVLSFVAIKYPYLVQEVDLAFFLWNLSGIVLVVTLGLKISVFAAIWRRSKNPEYFHINYFGKKVYEKKIITQPEFLSMLVSFPFFLIIGAYFIAKLINYMRFGFN